MASCTSQADNFRTMGSEDGSLAEYEWDQTATELGLQEVLSNNRVADIFCYVLSCVNRSHLLIFRTSELSKCTCANGRLVPTLLRQQLAWSSVFCIKSSVTNLV